MADKLILRSVTSPYNDLTKNKVLSTKELDTNQIYLKGLTIGSATYEDNTLSLNKLNGDTVSVNITGGSSGSTTDYGNIIFVSEVGTSGVTRTSIIGDINSPVNLDYATQIAESGDTIHVKSGVYYVTTTGGTGLSVDGVNHYFEDGAKVYKSTSGDLFATSVGGPILTEANVFGSGSFYGSGDCGYIFNHLGLTSDVPKTFEWDICENTVNSCYFGLFCGNTILRGKRKMISNVTCIRNSPSDFYDTYIECPVIESLSGNCISSYTGGGTMGNLTVKGDRITSSSSYNSVSNGTITNPELVSIYTSNHADNAGIYIEANYISSVAIDTPSGIGNCTINVGRLDLLWNKGTYIKVNGHVGQLEHITGFSDIGLCDMPRASGSGRIDATLNGLFEPQADYQQQIPISGSISLNLSQHVPQNGGIVPKFGTGRFISTTNGINLVGDWYIDATWCTVIGQIKIPSGTVLNIGGKPFKPYGFTGGTISYEIFNASADILVEGRIVEHCDYDLGPCPSTDGTITMDQTPIFRNTANTIFNGATYVARNEHSQLIGASSTGTTSNVYAGGLTTNKIDVFGTTPDKFRVGVTGVGAEFTINGETFTTTTGTTIAECAEELTSLVNASGTVNVTASQDTSGVDSYLYLTSDVIADMIVVAYDINTELEVVLDRLNLGVTETVGGTVIENVNVTDYFYEGINN